LGLTVAAAACGPRPVSLTVLAYDFAFQPDTIEVQAGAEVTLTLVNGGRAEHVWLLLDKDHELTLPYDADDSEFALASTIADVTGRETFTFTAPSEPGEYTIVCSIPEHAAKGMVGTLIVK
jgi:plastocyanin